MHKKCDILMLIARYLSSFAITNPQHAVGCALREIAELSVELRVLIVDLMDSVLIYLN